MSGYRAGNSHFYWGERGSHNLKNLRYKKNKLFEKYEQVHFS